jgi:SAM-dependent methyltransferase
VGRLLRLVPLEQGARLLDCPCGQGRHSRLLADAGFRVDGVDYSANLLRLARQHALRGRLSFTRADMRNLPARWTGRFGAVLNLFSSFGFFLDPGDDARVVQQFSRVLRPGGILVWHGANRDVVASRYASRDWWESSDGTLVLQERAMDQLSGVLTVRTTWRRGEDHLQREHRIRLYSATRLAELFAAHGLLVEQALDGEEDHELTRRSSTMLLVARKVAPAGLSA